MIYICTVINNLNNKQMTNLKAKVNTKSNYKNLNGQWLEVKEFLGTLVACIIVDENGQIVTTDFNIKEIEEIKQF